MTKIITFYKKYWVIVLLAFIATSLLLIKIFLVSDKEKPSPVQISIQTETFNGIVPGKSNIEDLNKILGAPDPKQSDFTNNTLSYSRKGGGPNHQAITDGETKILLFKEKSLTGTIEEYVVKYGKPEAEYFGDNASVGFKLYVWARLGFAIEASINKGLIFEKWYFAPISIEDFKNKWGQNLKSELSPENSY